MAVDPTPLRWNVNMAPAERAFIVAAYDEEISFIDSQLERLKEVAAAAERLDSSVTLLQAMTGRAKEKAALDPNRLKSIIAELETSLGRFEQAEDRFWKELKK